MYPFLFLMTTFTSNQQYPVPILFSYFLNLHQWLTTLTLPYQLPVLVIDSFPPPPGLTTSVCYHIKILARPKLPEIGVTYESSIHTQEPFLLCPPETPFQTVN